MNCKHCHRTPLEEDRFTAICDIKKKYFTEIKESFENAHPKHYCVANEECPFAFMDSDEHKCAMFGL